MEHHRGTTRLAALPACLAIAAKKYASSGRAERAGSPVDLLALHRRAAASLRRYAADAGAKERAVRAIRALDEGAGAVRRCSVQLSISVSAMAQHFRATLRYAT